MIVYPAIDIRGGRAVRLVEGDYNQETVFDTDPVEAALRWAGAGADWIHIVDLDAARDGVRANANAICRIHEATTVKLELGVGLRSLEAIHEVANLGIDRMIIGSAAISNRDLVAEAVHIYGERIAVGLDARDGKLAASGWLHQTNLDAVDAARQFADIGVKHFIFTDIRRDGKLMGPNLAALRAMIDAVPVDIIASGGIGTYDDIRAVREAGAAGVVIGAALYKGTVQLETAMSVAAGREVEA